MKIKNCLIILITASCFLSCSVDDENNASNITTSSTNGLQSGEYMCESYASNIIGARCNDGTRSEATGQGACSRHGGVNYWICR